MVSRRQERIADLLREELGLLISSELTDPRLEDAMLTVTDVQVSADLHTAHVYVEHALGEQQTKPVLAALTKAESFLRRALVENLDLRFVPDLFFHIDMTERRAQHIEALLETISVPGPTPVDQEHHADASEPSRPESDRDELPGSANAADRDPD